MNHIVADGPGRFRVTGEQWHEIQQAVAAKYAGQLAKAGFFGRLLTRWRMRRELARELHKMTPSPYCLWSRRR